MNNLSVELPYQHGDIVYVDGSPYERTVLWCCIWGKKIFMDTKCGAYEHKKEIWIFRMGMYISIYFFVLS